MVRELAPDQDNYLMELGRFISADSYNKERKEIEIGNMKLDLLKRRSKSVVVCEIKKSSKFLKAAEMQLLFYLYQLKKRGIEATGELLIPKERKRLKVELTAKKEEEVKSAISEIKEIIKNSKPSAPVKSRFCGKCAYKEFCWA